MIIPSHCIYTHTLIVIVSAFKVICCTFGDAFTVQDWHKVARWVLSLTRTRMTSPTSPPSSSKTAPVVKKISTSSISSESSGRSSRPSISSTASKSSHLPPFPGYYQLFLHLSCVKKLGGVPETAKLSKTLFSLQHTHTRCS